mgnify:CR=1 FL=1
MSRNESDHQQLPSIVIRSELPKVVALPHATSNASKNGWLLSFGESPPSISSTASLMARLGLLLEYMGQRLAAASLSTHLLSPLENVWSVRVQHCSRSLSISLSISKAIQMSVLSMTRALLSDFQMQGRTLVSYATRNTRPSFFQPLYGNGKVSN